MPQTLDTHANDQSSYTVECSFTDEDGNAVAPVSLQWTLLSPTRAVVNSRENVNVTSPSATETITLVPADLNHDDGAYRYLVLDWTYNSNYGTGLAAREQIRINIDDIKEKV